MLFIKHSAWNSEKHKKCMAQKYTPEPSREVEWSSTGKSEVGF